MKHKRSCAAAANAVSVAMLLVAWCGAGPGLGYDAILSWDHSVDPTVIGYRVYQGLASGVYDVFIDVGYVTSLPLTGLEYDVTYYFAASSLGLDAFGQPAEGPLSAELAHLTLTPGLVDSTPPSVELISPVDGAILARRQTIELRAEASDDVAVVEVRFSVDEARQCTVPLPPYTCAWRTPSRRGRTYVLEVEALDAAGNRSSDAITVQVR
jgi:hypothetical protein